MKEVLATIGRATEKHNSLIRTLEVLRHRKIELLQYFEKCQKLEMEEANTLESVKSQIGSYEMSVGLIKSDIDNLETTSNSLRETLKETEAVERHVDTLQSSLQEKQQELEGNSSTLTTIEQELFCLKTANEERETNFQSSQRTIEIEKRYYYFSNTPTLCT